MTKRLDYQQVEDLCVPGVYWVDEMVRALQENMKAHGVTYTITKVWGEATANILLDPKDSNYYTVYGVCEQLTREMMSYDDTENVFKSVVFNIVEDVYFNVSEISRAYEQARKVVELVGNTIEPDTWMIKIGANVGGFNYE